VATDLGGTVKSTAAVAQEPNGLLAASARLTGTPLTWPASERLQSAPGAPVTLSLWVKPDAGTSLTGTLLSQGPLSLSVAEGKLSLKLGSVQTTGGELTAATWSHVVLALGVGKLTLYVNGTQVAQADQVPAGLALTGSISLGDGFKGLVDEFQWAATVRSADWVKLSHASQAADAKLIATALQNGDQAEGEEGGGGGYLGILIKNLTPDAKAVIGLLAMMFLVALWVIVVKARLVSVTDRDNRRFLRRFREASNVLTLADEDLPHSSLQRLYRTGLAELTKRDVSHSGKALSGASIDAVKASIDADLVREGHTLNASMVWLTIAISGGPFLGLLGTVVGVMITFAAIAAAGDVNVNAIAPGIAAALLATVAGLGVAIPALFAYNYLASRIKNISSDMQIFVDEFVTRVAETYGAP
jgi:biopolymer transport protein ExbB